MERKDENAAFSAPSVERNDEESISSDVCDNAGTTTDAETRAQKPRLSTVSLVREQSDVPDEFQVDAAAATVQCGDFVLLGDGVPQEYRACPAIITKVADTHCTVAVLDGDMQYGLGECWPCFHDISVRSTMLRLGKQVVITGMSGARTKHLNDLTGTISEHPREGHPSFVRKSKCPECPRLTVCISFNDPDAAKQHSALIEPQFLMPFDDAALQTAQCLQDAVELLSPVPVVAGQL
jgi:hypothetical protein